MNSRRSFLKKGFVAAGASMLPLSLNAKDESQKTSEPKYVLPYKNTYIKEPLVTDNSYRGANAEIHSVNAIGDMKATLPVPIWEGHPKEIEMYWKAWEIGINNIKSPQGNSGFVSSYIDTAYNGNIFMWDSAFITIFARYGSRLFPFQKTLDNFYAKQHPDGFICREIKADGADCFERYDPVSTGPNLLPWSEMVYFKHFGDLSRLHKVFPVLCAYYKWLKLNRTWPDGTYWSSGWGTGMDNMPRVQPKYNLIYSHGHMVWLDTCLQQLMVANILLEMGLYLERWQEIEDFEDEVRILGAYITKNLWNPGSNFLFDRYADGTLSKTKGIGAFWALFTDLLTKEQLTSFTNHLKDPNSFNRKYRVPSLSAEHEKYKANGRYWQGGIWAPTNYMIMDGLRQKGFDTLRHEIAMNHYNQILEVYNNTGTLWEYYSPESAEPGFMARPDFVGWTGLPPIAVLFEHVFGIYPDFHKKKITWHLYLTEEHGIHHYPWGPDGNISLLSKARKGNNDSPELTVESNTPFNLEVIWKNRIKTFKVESGMQTISIQ